MWSFFLFLFSADPVIDSKVTCMPADAVIIHCGVGDRAL